MTYRIPPLTGEPCSCPACTVAGVTDLPVVRTPDGELHGVALARWYREREKTMEAVQAFKKTPLGREPGEDDA